jgi:hypothetical protein
MTPEQKARQEIDSDDPKTCACNTIGIRGNLKHFDVLIIDADLKYAKQLRL